MAKDIKQEEYVETKPTLESRLKEIEDKQAEIIAENERLKSENEALKAKSLEPKTAVSAIGNMVLICNSKVRRFTVRPEKVIKIYKGTVEGIILKDRVLTITPGSIIEVNPELAEFLLSYPRDFSRYDVPLV